MPNPTPLKNANSARPSELGSPVPGKDSVDDFLASLPDSPPKALPAVSASSAPALSEGNDVDSFLASLPGSQAPAQAPNQPQHWYNVSAKGLEQGAFNALPAVGGALGGVGGFAMGGPVGSLAGAGAGAVAGASLKASIEKALGQPGPQSREEFYTDLAKSGKEGVESQAIGEMLPAVVQATKKLGKAGITKVGNMLAGVPPSATGSYINAPQAVKELAAQTNGDVATAADQIRGNWSQAIDQAQGEMEKPALEVMVNRGTVASDREIGDSVKNLIKQDVAQRYGPFQQAYSDLGQVSKATPLSDEARKGFQDSVRSWALEEFPQSSQSWNLVKKYTDAFSASNNGAQFDSVVGDLNDEITTAFRSGEVKKAKVLMDLKGQASDFLDGQVDGLAKRIQAGKATPDEMGFIQKIVQTRGIQEENPTQYAKSLAKDYLASRNKINSDYSGFKDFMGGLTEQTKIRNNGTMDFLSKLDDVPSEKLVAKMFDENNTQALQTMKEETPQVFDQLARFRVKQLAQDSMIDGKLNIPKFFQNVQDLAPEVRDLIFSPQDQQVLASTVANPKYKLLNETLDNLHPSILTPGSNYNPIIAAGGKNPNDLTRLNKLSLITGQNMVKDAQTLGALEYYGKSTLSRAKLLQTSIDAATAIGNKIPNVGFLNNPAGQQIAGQAVMSAAPVVNQINPLRKRK